MPDTSEESYRGWAEGGDFGGAGERRERRGRPDRAWPHGEIAWHGGASRKEGDEVQKEAAQEVTGRKSQQSSRSRTAPGPKTVRHVWVWAVASHRIASHGEQGTVGVLGKVVDGEASALDKSPRLAWPGLDVYSGSETRTTASQEYHGRVRSAITSEGVRGSDLVGKQKMGGCDGGSER